MALAADDASRAVVCGRSHYTSTVIERSMTNRSLSRRWLLASALATAACAWPHRSLAQPPAFPWTVDLGWLADRGRTAGLRLFDVSPLHVFRSGHIESAEHAWWRDTIDPNYPVYGAVLTQGDDQAHRQRVVDSLGLSDADDIVVYDNISGFHAARLVWFLRFLGFDRSALLTAGYREWRSNPSPIMGTPRSGDRTTVRPQEGYYLVTQQVVDRLADPETRIVDIRTENERLDDLGGAMPLGRIPGSQWLPWTSLLDERGYLAAEASIAQTLQRAGLHPQLPTILYGRFGADTALAWIALKRSGFTDVRSYDRGWVEWSQDPTLPKEPLA